MDALTVREHTRNFLNLKRIYNTKDSLNKRQCRKKVSASVFKNKNTDAEEKKNLVKSESF